MVMLLYCLYIYQMQLFPSMQRVTHIHHQLVSSENVGQYKRTSRANSASTESSASERKQRECTTGHNIKSDDDDRKTTVSPTLAASITSIHCLFQRRAICGRLGTFLFMRPLVYYRRPCAAPSSRMSFLVRLLFYTPWSGTKTRLYPIKLIAPQGID
ncbi:unnamed protein product [Ceratitis capitata]|uniref:(Mediterranean fruit fly) hypothetical protein n=1 Tax=Ceratitis capitata TaxID=7213 RepID=A0A811VB70_CERCA|nr:unnamed protein product [Ceratitis capitata]